MIRLWPVFWLALACGSVAEAPSQRLALLFRLTSPDATGVAAGGDFFLAAAATALMASKHCSERDGSIVAELGASSMSACAGLQINFTLFDTGLDAFSTIRMLIAESSLLDAVVGADRSSVTIPLSTVASSQGIPTVGYFSTSPALSARENSLFTRTIPSDAGTSQAVCALLGVHSVSHATILHTDDQYGMGFRDELVRNCKGSTVMLPAGFSTGNEASLTIAANFAAERRLNVIVAIVFDEDLPALFALLRARGLVGEGRMLVLTDSVTDAGLNAYARVAGTPTAAAVFRQAARITATGHGSGSAFERYAAAFSTWASERQLLNEQLAAAINATILNNGVALPDLSPFLLDPGFFSRVAATQFAGVSSFAYDAVVLACRSVCLAARQRNVTAGAGNGKAIYEAALAGAFEGASGGVRVDPGTGTRSIATSTFSLETFRAASGDAGGSVLVSLTGLWRAGSWSLPDSFERLWPAAVDYEERHSYLSPALKVVFVCFSALLVGACAALAVFTHRKRHTRIIARAQPSMLLLFLAGVAVSSLSVVFVGFEDMDPTTFSHTFLDASCMAFYWLWSLGTTLTFAALTAKLYRIHRIFTNQALKSIALSSQHMFGAVTLLCLVDIVLMLLWQLVAPLHYVEVVLEQGPYSEPLATRGTCISSNRHHHAVLFIALVVVYVCLLFVAGVTYSYMVRKVDSVFQESQWITIALVSQFQLYLVGIPLVVIFSVNGWGRFFVVSSVVLLNNLVLLTVMFWPKVHAVSKRLQRAASLATIASDRKPPGGGAHAAAEDDPESLPLRNPSYALRSGSFKSATQSSYRTVDEGDRPFIERVEHLLVLRRASSSVSLSAGESPRKRRHVGLQVNVSDHVSEVSVDDAPASDNEPAPPASLPASVPTPPRSAASGEKSRESQDTGQPSSTEELECKRD